MAKPLNEFGGWLRFFQIGNILGIVIGALASLFFLYVYYDAASAGEYMPDVTNASLLFLVIEMPVLFYFTIKILGYLKVKSTASPDNITQYIRYTLIFCLVTGVVELLVYLNLRNSAEQIIETVKMTIQSIISAAIWLSYFKKSVRVKQFYGKNAGESFSYAAAPDRLSESAE